MKHRLIVIPVLLLALLGLFFAYQYYLSVYLPRNNIEQAFNNESKLYERMKPEIDFGAKDTIDSINELKEEKQLDSKQIKAEDSLLAPCSEVNDDAAAWIYIPDTNIDFPVMHTDDNDFYLHNGADGKYNYELGCPFLDFRCEEDFSGFNSIVYGHHMTEQRMFAYIALFSEEPFMLSHEVGYLVLPDQVHTVDFIAYLNVPSTSAAYHTVFLTMQEKEDYLGYIFSFAKYTHGMTIDDLKEKNDLHLLLLSTCTYEYDNARGILVGVID